MDISWIIVNWRTKELVRDLIASIVLTNPPTLEYEIIVVDNNSDDGSVEYLKSLHNLPPSFHIIDLQKNIGYGPAHNTGLKIANGEWVFFLNSDVVILDGCIQEMHRIASKDPMAGIYVPLVLNQDLSIQDIYGHLPGYDMRLFVRWFTRMFFYFLPHRSQRQEIHSKETETLETAEGVAYFISKKFLSKYGAWDENFIMYCEDIEFCYRMYTLGKKCIGVKNARLVHLRGASSQIIWNKERRGRIIEVSKNILARKHAKPFLLYQFFWIFQFFKYFISAYLLKDANGKNGVRTKTWFLKKGFLLFLTKKIGDPHKLLNEALR